MWNHQLDLAPAKKRHVKKLLEPQLGDDGGKLQVVGIRIVALRQLQRIQGALQGLLVAVHVVFQEQATAKCTDERDGSSGFRII